MPSFALRSILVATDLGEESDYVVRTAAALAAGTGAALHLVHGFDLERTPADPGGARALGFQDRVAEAERLLGEQIARAAEPLARPASRIVRNYVPARAIEERAKAVAADLIVLGRSRKKGLEARTLGTTADQVTREAQVPCLVVPRALALPVRSVLVPTDFSDASAAALDAALGVLGAIDDPAAPATVELVHVEGMVEPEHRQEVERKTLLPKLQQQVDAAVRRATTPPAGEIRMRTVWNVDPTEGILIAARDADADLVVVATQGGGALKRLLVGSVASSVSRRAPSPVLLVPPPRA